MHIDFEISDNSTLGVEWEVALVDRDSGELAQRAQEVLEAVVSEYPELGEEGDHPQVTGEFLQNTVEMVTGVCRSVGEAVGQLEQMLPARRLECPMRSAGHGGDEDAHHDQIDEQEEEEELALEAPEEVHGGSYGWAGTSTPRGLKVTILKSEGLSASWRDGVKAGR